MYFRIASCLISLEICVVLFFSSVNQIGNQEVVSLHPPIAIANEESTPKPPRMPRIIIPFSALDTQKALENASPLAKCIVRYEVGGGTRKYIPWSPYAIGAAGELGAVQLHPRGKLSEFYKLGFTNPFDPYQAVAYLEDALKRGQKYHWSPVVNGLCK